MENIKQIIRGNPGECLAFYDEHSNSITTIPIVFWALESDNMIPLTPESYDSFKNTSDSKLEDGRIASNFLGIIWGKSQYENNLNVIFWTEEIARMKQKQEVEKWNTKENK